jgi:hypothetical protein
MLRGREIENTYLIARLRPHRQPYWEVIDLLPHISRKVDNGAEVKWLKQYSTCLASLRP